MIQNFKRVALFDFCETLVSFQTASSFIQYCVSKSNNRSSKIFYHLYKTLNKIKLLGIIRKCFPSLFIDKRLLSLQLRGFEENHLNVLAREFYTEKIKPNLIIDVINELQAKKKDNYKIIIVSGGFGIYIKYFAKDFNVDNVISTNLKFKRGKCTGFFHGIDCMGKNKIKLLTKIYGKVDTSQWYAYSDSFTDLPFLNFVRNPVVISHKNHQKWIPNKNFKEIIWI